MPDFRPRSFDQQDEFSVNLSLTTHLMGKDSSLQHPWTRAHNYYKRNVSRVLFRKPTAINLENPLISFTFDDFPRSALLTGGAILAANRIAGTYYTALGLLGTQGPSGPLFLLDDLLSLLAEGHELGSHTYSHCHSWETDTSAFERSVVENGSALRKLIPGAEFKSFSYPISEPRPLTKRNTARHFLSCRGGGQTFNAGRADLNRLAGYFLEKSRDNLQAVRDVIEENRRARGWLIFATHDIAENPSPYGCTPGFFEEVVESAINSGASILPVAEALEVVRSGQGQVKVQVDLPSPRRRGVFSK
jgi:peptidoglycan/xylan/chitin deacetylase (PgdA/CDA1 family)